MLPSTIFFDEIVRMVRIAIFSMPRHSPDNAWQGHSVHAFLPLSTPLQVFETIRFENRQAPLTPATPRKIFCRGIASMPYFRFPPHFKFSIRSASKTDKPLSLLLLPEKYKKPAEGNRQAHLLIERGTQSKKKTKQINLTRSILGE